MNMIQPADCPLVELLDATGTVVAEANDFVLHYMATEKLPMSVTTYVGLNWMGDKTVSDLEGEERAGLDELVEQGFLADVGEQIS